MSPLCKWGLWGTCLQQMEWKEVALMSAKTQVEVRGFVAQVSASLTYHNYYSEPLQVRYMVPVDEGAAVYKFEAHLDGRTITAQCMEKKAAEKVYKDAVQAGKTAVLAREDSRSSDVLNLQLGNLPPGSQAELKLGLVMELKVQTDGGVSFILPTFLKPRYTPDNPFGYTGKMEAELNTMFVSKQYTYEVKARVVGAHRIAQINSHSELLSVDISGDALSAEVSQCTTSSYDRDWTMLIYYADPYKTHILRETGDRSGLGLMKDDLLMINLFPEVPASSFSNKNEVIFLVDRSGSMNGDTMQSARATLLLFLKSLPVGCFFNIVSFGSTFSFLFPRGSEMYNEETLAKACTLQQTMEADMGGTEIFHPFKAIYSQPPKAGYARQLLLISDGSVWNVDQMTELVSRHAHESRVFAVGIGHGASSALIRGVARAGKGRSEMVFQQDKIQHKVMGLVTSMLQDSVQNVRVSCEVEPTSRVRLIPKVPPVIFGGQHLILYARIPANTMVKSVNIQGSLSSKDLNFVVKDTDVKVVHDGEMSLHRLAARAQISQWQVDQEEDIRDDMISLSLASGVISRLTALVGVDQEGKAIAREEEEEHHVPWIDCSTQLLSAMAPALSAPRCVLSPPPANQLSFDCAQPQSAQVSQFDQFGRAQPESAEFGCAQPESAQFDCAQPESAQFGSQLEDFTVFSAQSRSAMAPRCVLSPPPADQLSFGCAQPESGQFDCAQPQSAQFGSQLEDFTFGRAQPESAEVSQFDQFGCAQPESAQFDCAQPESAQVFSAQSRSAMAPRCVLSPPPADQLSFGCAQPESGQFDCAQPQSAQFGSQLEDFTFGCAQPESAEFGCAQPESAQFDCAQPESAQFGSQLEDFTVFSAQPLSAMAPRCVLSPPPADQLSVSWCSQEDSPDSAAPSPAAGTLMAIVSKQKFDGSWALEDMAELCGIVCTVLKERSPAKTEAAWATALALALLEEKHVAAQDQWSLLAVKARAFLSGCQEDVQALAEAARALLKERP